MANILTVSRGRPHGNTAQLAESFASGAKDAGHHVDTVSLLHTKVGPCLGCNACKQGKSCVQKDGFAELVNHIGFHDKGMLLAGGCGDTNWQPQIDRTEHLDKAYEFGENIYQ